MAGKKQAQQAIADLIQKYEAANKRALNEANTRKDYILPLFAALGWRTDDSGEVAEEVKVGRTWADYAFRLGGITRFYLEAKKADADLENLEFAHQAVSYAYNKGVSWAVLTNFEGLKLFSAEWDEREVNRLRVLDLRYDQYLEYFDDLWALSRESVGDDGLRKKFEHRGGAVRKRQRVDERLFSLLKEWRLALIRLFVQYQPPDTPLRLGEIDEAVQRILDRLIFIRTVEDRRIENPILSPIQRQRTAGQGKENAWELLVREFRRLDETYNSNLFAHHLADDLRGDESVFLPLLAQLYSPDAAAFRFDFSAIEADVLGRVYEQYLGHVIETTKSPVSVGGKVYLPGLQPANAEMVDVVAKQAKRKQQGIYYTPKYIVDYIVEQTLGRLLEEQGGDANFVSQIAVLDPACGSGSFLIAAYDRLLKYYAELWQVPGGAGNLDQQQRVEILLRHIYGVDLDGQAVEIARLNLLLRALKEPKLLPELDGNIVRGNSLIGEIEPHPPTPSPPGGEGENGGAAVPEGAHPLNWWERFPTIMNRGGFDVVIGNPPYVRQEVLSELKRYFEEHYESYQGTADLYVYFMERGLSLLREGGVFSIIVSSSFLRTSYAIPLRNYLSRFALLRLIDFGGLPVFESAKDTYVCIPLIRKGEQPDRMEICHVSNLDDLDLGKYVPLHSYTISASQLTPSGWFISGEHKQSLVTRLKELGVPLSEYIGGKIHRGVTSGFNDAFVIDAATRDRLIAEDPRSAELIKPFVQGRDVRRFYILQKEQYLIFTRRGIEISSYPAIESHLALFNAQLMPRPDDRGKEEWAGRKPGDYQWYEIQDSVDYYSVFEEPKIVYPDIAKGPRFALDLTGAYISNTAYCLGTDDLFLLGILNSRLFWFMIGAISIPFGTRAGQYRYRLIYQYMEKVPIRPIDFANPADVAMHDRVVAHVERLLELHQRRQDVTELTEEWQEIGREIEAEDAALDGIVYQLYGLTEEEIAVVEGRV